MITLFLITITEEKNTDEFTEKLSTSSNERFSREENAWRHCHNFHITSFLGWTRDYRFDPGGRRWLRSRPFVSAVCRRGTKALIFPYKQPFRPIKRVDLLNSQVMKAVQRSACSTFNKATILFVLAYVCFILTFSKCLSRARRHGQTSTTVFKVGRSHQTRWRSAKARSFALQMYATFETNRLTER